MIKKNKGSRSWSRILAVQALYQLSLNKDAKESKVIKDLIQNKESKNRADKIFLSVIPSSFSLKMSSSFFITSKTPPPDGISVNSLISVLYLSKSSFARLAALGR